MNTQKLTLKQAVSALKSGEIKASELASHFLDRAEADQKAEKAVNAVIHTDREKTLAMASEADKDSLLAGATVHIKDNMNVEGWPVQCSSKILETYISPYTGGSSNYLLKNGGVIGGMTNMDEFAMGSSTETSARGITRNPHNLSYAPGGSSGGAAAAVAGDLTLASLGSDTGGSIRQPGSFCGVVGMKPTYGTVSRYGLVAFGSSLDQIGPITKTVEDAALLLEAVAGHDFRDSTSLENLDNHFSGDLNSSLKGKKIGLPREYFTDALDPEVAEKIEQVKNFYREAGCEFVEVSLPTTEYSIGTYYVIATAEASANLARFDGVRYGRRSEKATSLKEVYFKSRSEGFGEEVKRRILLGTYVLSSGYYEAYYLKAQKVRRLIKEDYEKVFQTVDMLLTPTVPDPVFKLGERTDDPIKMYLSDIFTTPANLAGVPAMSVPCGKDKNGLPVGFQLIAPHFREKSLFNFGHIYDLENNPLHQV